MQAYYAIVCQPMRVNAQDHAAPLQGERRIAVLVPQPSNRSRGALSACTRGAVGASACRILETVADRDECQLS
jgi:hypothetical protein